MSSPNPDADRPRRLPIQVPLRPGEHPVAFIRRLAEANHLRPSHLRLYLNVLPGKVGRISIERLAAVTGRTAEQLRRVMPTLPPATPKPPPRPRRPAPEPGQRRAATTARQRQATPKPYPITVLPDGTSQIDPTAHRHPVIIELSRHFGVPRRIIIQALTGHIGARDHLRPHRTPSLNPLAEHIGQILATNPSATVRSIWQQLTGEHGARVSYGTVRNHISRLRAHPDDPRYLKALISRTDLFATIREHATRLASLDNNPVPDQDEPAPDTTPTPRHSDRNNDWHTRCLEPWHPLIDQMITDDPRITVAAIWSRLIDEHNANVSYNTVRHHVSQVHRPPSQRTPVRGRSSETTTREP